MVKEQGGSKRGREKGREGEGRKESRKQGKRQVVPLEGGTGFEEMEEQEEEE